MTDDLVKRLRIIPDQNGLMYVDYEDVMQAADRIEAQAAEIERLQVEAKAQFDRGYYEGCANPIVRHDALREHLISALDTLKDAEVCGDNCGPCNEARAALQEQSK